MSIDEITNRINYLYKKSKEEELTDVEKVEQKELRQKYIDNVKRNFRAQLDTIKSWTLLSVETRSTSLRIESLGIESQLLKKTAGIMFIFKLRLFCCKEGASLNIFANKRRSISFNFFIVSV